MFIKKIKVFYLCTYQFFWKINKYFSIQFNILKKYDAEFSYMDTWFINQNSKPLDGYKYNMRYSIEPTDWKYVKDWISFFILKENDQKINLLMYIPKKHFQI